MAHEIPGLDTKQLYDLFEICPDVHEVMIQTNVEIIPVTEGPKVDISGLIEGIMGWKAECHHNICNSRDQIDLIRGLLAKHGITKGE